jgi:hypothetical protein
MRSWRSSVLGVVQGIASAAGCQPNDGVLFIWVGHTLFFPADFQDNQDWTTVQTQEQVSPDRKVQAWTLTQPVRIDTSRASRSPGFHLLNTEESAEKYEELRKERSSILDRKVQEDRDISNCQIAEIHNSASMVTEFFVSQREGPLKLTQVR